VNLDTAANATLVSTAPDGSNIHPVHRQHFNHAPTAFRNANIDRTDFPSKYFSLLYLAEWYNCHRLLPSSFSLASVWLNESSVRLNGVWDEECKVKESELGGL